MNVNHIIHGDNIEVLKTYPDNSIDSIVTDAPYGLGKEPDPVKVMKAWAECGHYEVQGKGFMGKTWDAFVPQPAFWTECYRVLKPGGHVLCFFGTRTYDWGVMAMRFAGFEVRDCLQWIYGSGFPKSLSIDKSIDKEAGIVRPRVPGGVGTDTGYSGGFTPGEAISGEAISGEAKQWQGWGTALKPAVEPIVLARKPISEKTIAANVLKWGTGGLNIDGCRIETDDDLNGGAYSHGEYDTTGKTYELGLKRITGKYQQPLGRFPSNVIFDEQAAELLDKQSGKTTSGTLNGTEPSITTNGIYGEYADRSLNTYGDTGYASRFFYIAKASPGEREQGVRWMKRRKVNDGRNAEVDNAFQRGETLRANIHPTIKPISLMQHLVRLITPSGGICVDPFAGSGTTCIACKLENIQYIGIEMDAEYVNIAQERIKAYATQLKIF